jgi:hypothetical protein
LRSVEIEGPDPDALAAHWAQLFERPVREQRIALDSGSIDFLPGAGEPVLAGVVLKASRPSTHDLCGVRFRLVDR